MAENGIPPFGTVHIVLKIVKDGQIDRPKVGYTLISFYTGEITPVSIRHEEDVDIDLSQLDGRPYSFTLTYEASTENNPNLPDGRTKYSWDNNPLNNIKIWEGDAEPPWGTPLPADFHDIKIIGNILYFLDINGSDGKSFNYCIRLSLTGSPGVYSDPLDPKITNSGRGT